MFHVKHPDFFALFPRKLLQEKGHLDIMWRTCGYGEPEQWFRIWKVGAFVAKTIAIVNQKGGVGKTTTCVNLAAALVEAGKRVLLCDFDPQANATSGMGVDKTVSKGVYEVVIGEVPANDAIAHTKYGDVLPSNKALAGAGIELIAMDHRETLLKDALAELKDQYDFIFIDCPPSLELLTLNALCAADSILVPVQGEYFALEGLSDLLNTVRLVRRSLNPRLELEGVLLTMFDGRTNLALQVAEEVKHYFPGKVYATVIPRNVRLSEAPSHGKPITSYDRTSRGAEAYTALAAEFLRKQIA
jgi:chromosome partitioning protein